MRKRIFRLSSLLAGCAVLMTALLVTLAASRDFSRTLRQELRVQTGYVAAGLGQGGESYLSLLNPPSGYRVTLILPDGTVRYDSFYPPASLDNHLNRPEVASALKTGAGESTRYSDTLRERTLYHAVLLPDGSVLRLSVTTDSVFTSLGDLVWLLGLIVLGVFFVASLVAGAATRRIVKPINALDLDHPDKNTVYEELAPLLGRIKSQRGQIDSHIRDLDRQRAEFSRITENMSEGFLVVNREGKILSHNQSALTLLGTPQKDALGQNVLSLNRSEDFRAAIWHAYGGAPYECVLPLSSRFCQVMVSPVETDGQVHGAVILLVDITEKQEREQLRREFSANVSHELKTPLTAISGYAEIIKTGVAKAEDVSAFAGHIHDEAQRLIALISDLIFLSRLDELPQDLPREPVNLLALARTAAERLAPKAREHNILLTLSGEEVSLPGIPPVLEEIAYNLIDNAIKYNTPGGRVGVSVTRAGNDALLAVSDTGPGIPKGERERIFERFYRIDKSHNKEIEGTGLGLAIVKHGARLHQAKIELESGPKGSTFTVRFPL